MSKKQELAKIHEEVSTIERRLLAIALVFAGFGLMLKDYAFYPIKRMLKFYFRFFSLLTDGDELENECNSEAATVVSCVVILFSVLVSICAYAN